MTQSHGEPDIDVNSTVEADEMRFAEVPETRVDFFGTPGRDSESGSERSGLPGRVEREVPYRDIRVDHWIRSRIVGYRMSDRNGSRDGDA